jgi:hypothetical protein
LVSPSEGEVEGIVTIEVEVTTCESRAKKVICYVDDEEIGSDELAPYSLEWDTAEADEGEHTLRCEVHDIEGVAGTTTRAVVVPPAGVSRLVVILFLAVIFVLLLALLILRRRRRELEFFEEEYIPEELASELATAEIGEELPTEDISVSLFKPVATLRVIQSVELSPGETFELFARSTSIGRSADNDILIPDRPISREHASLIFEEGHFRILDVGSTFGTKVNGVSVPSEGTVLKDKDKIQLGTRTVLEFSQLEAETWPPGEETRGMAPEEEETRDIGREIDGPEETRDMEELE